VVFAASCQIRGSVKDLFPDHEKIPAIDPVVKGGTE